MRLTPERRQPVLWMALFLALLAALSLHGAARAQIGPMPAPPAASAEQPPLWTEPAGDDVAVHLYVFHSLTCPHCRAAMPFVEALPAKHPWLRIHTYELSQSQANALGYDQFASALGQQAMYVPAFFYCGQMITGYDTAEAMGAAIEADLIACHDESVAALGPRVAAAAGAAPEGTPAAVEGAAAAATGDVGAAPALATGALAAENAAVQAALPSVGGFSLGTLSLPVLTITLAGLDAFNPCAFFVLMFLLSLLVHAGSRSRMLLVGGLFVLFSGLIYFVFMAAWLNVFLLIGELQMVTLIAGIVATVLALINIKDYFWFKQGVSLSIPEGAKPGLFKRMRGLIGADSMFALVGSTVVLAVAVNSYELLCTSGFPMIYTRALTLTDLSTAAFYGYLALYNVVYVLPLLAIVSLFALRFGSRKLSEREGRTLKLLSGIMMLLLGLLLIFAPNLLDNALTAVGLLALALLVTWGIAQWEKRHAHAPRATPRPPRPA